MSINREIVKHIIEDSESALATKILHQHLLSFLLEKGVIEKEEYLTSLNFLVEHLVGDPNLKKNEEPLGRIVGHINEVIQNIK